jgi:hypothetical protein
MFGDRTCECRADVTEHTRTWCNTRERWRTGRMRVSIGKVVHRIRHKKIVVTVHRDSGATEIFSIYVARERSGQPGIRSEVRTSLRVIYPAVSSRRRVRKVIAAVFSALTAQPDANFRLFNLRTSREGFGLARPHASHWQPYCS